MLCSYSGQDDMDAPPIGKKPDVSAEGNGSNGSPTHGRKKAGGDIDSPDARPAAKRFRIMGIA